MFVRINGKSLADREEKENKLQSFLSDNGIASGLHYPVPYIFKNVSAT